MSTELMKNIETTELMKNIETIRNWDIIKDTDALVSTNEGISSFFVDSNLNGDFTEVKYEIDRSETGKLTVCGIFCRTCTHMAKMSMEFDKNFSK